MVSITAVTLSTNQRRDTRLVQVGTTLPIYDGSGSHYLLEDLVRFAVRRRDMKYYECGSHVQCGPPPAAMTQPFTSSSFPPLTYPSFPCSHLVRFYTDNGCFTFFSPFGRLRGNVR